MVKVSAILAILGLTWIIGAGIYMMVGPGYQFKNEVHGHMENAYVSNTPTEFIAELREAKQGMIDIGLKPEMYGAVLPWHKTADMRMDYWYRHIDGVIERAQSARVDCDPNRQSRDTLTDICEQKMTNLRTFLKEGGWSDEVPKEAYYANYYPLLYFNWTIFWFVFILPALALCVTGLVQVRIYENW